MPADFVINARLGVVFSRGFGVFCRADALEHMDQLLRHPDFRPEFNQLADFRQITELALTADEVGELSRRRVFSDRSRRAFVVAGDLQYGYSRMFGSFRRIKGELGVATFRDMAEALCWLSLPAEGDPGTFAGPEPAKGAPTKGWAPPAC